MFRVICGSPYCSRHFRNLNVNYKCGSDIWFHLRTNTCKVVEIVLISLKTTRHLLSGMSDTVQVQIQTDVDTA